MNKLHKILIIVFCLGIFICGIGSGIAFTEFSTLSYGGEQILGEPDMRTENFDVAFEPGEEPKEIAGSYVQGWNTYHVQTDNEIPENIVRFCVTYNANTVTPYAYWDEESDRIICSYYWHDTYDNIAYMMEAKDVVLQNLKEGRLVSFDVPDLEEVTILVNPQTVPEVWARGGVLIH